MHLLYSGLPGKWLLKNDVCDVCDYY